MNRVRSLVFAFCAALVASACFGGDGGGADDDDDDNDSGEGGTGGSTGGATTGGSGGASGGTGGSTGGGTTGGSGGASGGTGGSTGGGTTGGSGGASGGAGGTGGSTGGVGGSTGGGTTGGAGGASGGTGGAAGTGGGGTGGSAGAPTCAATFAVYNGGYMAAQVGGSCWHGHAYIGSTAGSTYAPLDFGTCAEPCSLCASGTLMVDATFATTGWIGVNLNQEYMTDVAGVVTPTGTSLVLSYTNAGGTALRVQLGGPNAATDPLERWCYALSAASGTVTIPYTSFRTECWDVTGTAYAGQPIQSISLTFPSSDVTTTPWSACITGLQ